ncbi:sulfur carrier protein ThiS [Gilvimarinus sp. SDUM040013]|uniref:Sulfur carrier protein ThiS n=1 Tax=Gilvimarinus gilvus TaxID=3058038 RepID=A0ABU4RUD4_9GAMM|nr:sulfur carrier protein ThiS [Gilvimarinus sp. SDUM040013]MDO3385116.1 sulfur carrier protein ThiS [Gilvimarinus sp. SDUM040013]MDX6848491.1 sulfur carrier protein ThiS [Gilvimarinus sp. SDUM040013]
MKSNSLRVVINAESYDLKCSAKLTDALSLWQSHCGEVEHFACAINGEFVPRSTYTTTKLNDGDCIDIVRPVGGG